MGARFNELQLMNLQGPQEYGLISENEVDFSSIGNFFNFVWKLKNIWETNVQIAKWLKWLNGQNVCQVH